MDLQGHKQVKADPAISSFVNGVSGYSVAFMCSKKLDFKSCAIVFGFRKFSHICNTSIICMANCLQQGRPSMNA